MNHSVDAYWRYLENMMRPYVTLSLH